jgi:hypothetical protein
MGNDADYWVEIGRRLGIEVIAPANLKVPGIETQFTALLPQFGAASGMVVDADWNAIEPHRAALTAAGYGYSCVTAGDAADTDSVTEMLADWGWTSASPKPDWLAA